MPKPLRAYVPQCLRAFPHMTLTCGAFRICQLGLRSHCQATTAILMNYKNLLSFSETHSCRQRRIKRATRWGALCLLTVAVGSADLAWAQSSGATTPWLEVLESARSRAIDQILDSSHSETPYIRANAIEAAHHLPHRVVPIVQLGLKDRHEAVRFAAAVTIGSLQIKRMAPAVLPLTNDPSESVRAAALFALHRCGAQVDLNPLAAMLASPKPTVRGNVAILFGKMDDPGTAPMLKELAATPIPRASAVQEAIIRIQIAESIVHLGDEGALNAIRAAAYSQFDEVRVLSVSMLGGFKDRRMAKGFAQMLLEPPIELQIAAAGALADLGRFEGEPIVMRASRSDFPTVRAQTALVLRRFRNPRSQKVLVKMLNDREEQVRLSAAAAILHTLSQRQPEPESPS